jgi:hypothetical protein
MLEMNRERGRSAMTRTTRKSGKGMTTPTAPTEGPGERRHYREAFTRVRLVRAWIAAAAALVAVLSSCVALLERVWR